MTSKTNSFGARNLSEELQDLQDLQYREGILERTD